MGTYEHSKIQTASKNFECRHCGETIRRGSRYLRYAAGLKNRYPVCLFDAVNVKGFAGIRRYDCAAVRDWVEQSAALGPGAGA